MSSSVAPSTSSSSSYQNPPHADQEGIERKWDWIFKALYSISSRRQSSIILAIPDTVLFVQGAPTKWLGTIADGRIVRKIIQKRETSSYHSQSEIGAGQIENNRGGRNGKKLKVSNDEVLIIEQLMNIHQDFLKLASSSGTGNATAADVESSTSGSTLVAIAWYKDGKRETLKSESMLMLIKHREWRTQLVALQSYIPPSKVSPPNPTPHPNPTLTSPSPARAQP